MIVTIKQCIETSELYKELTKDREETDVLKSIPEKHRIDDTITVTQQNIYSMIDTLRFWMTNDIPTCLYAFIKKMDGKRLFDFYDYRDYPLIHNLEIYSLLLFTNKNYKSLISDRHNHAKHLFNSIIKINAISLLKYLDACDDYHFTAQYNINIYSSLGLASEYGSLDIIKYILGDNDPSKKLHQLKNYSMDLRNYGYGSAGIVMLKPALRHSHFHCVEYFINIGLTFMNMTFRFGDYAALSSINTKRSVDITNYILNNYEKMKIKISDICKDAFDFILYVNNLEMLNKLYDICKKEKCKNINQYLHYRYCTFENVKIIKYLIDHHVICDYGDFQETIYREKHDFIAEIILNNKMIINCDAVKKLLIEYKKINLLKYVFPTSKDIKYKHLELAVKRNNVDIFNFFFNELKYKLTISDTQLLVTAIHHYKLQIIHPTSIAIINAIYEKISEADLLSKKTMHTTIKINKLTSVEQVELYYKYNIVFHEYNAIRDAIKYDNIKILKLLHQKIIKKDDSFELEYEGYLEHAIKHKSHKSVKYLCNNGVRTDEFTLLEASNKLNDKWDFRPMDIFTYIVEHTDALSKVKSYDSRIMRNIIKNHDIKTILYFVEQGVPLMPESIIGCEYDKYKYLIEHHHLQINLPLIKCAFQNGIRPILVYLAQNKKEYFKSILSLDKIKDIANKYGQGLLLLSLSKIVTKDEKIDIFID